MERYALRKDNKREAMASPNHEDKPLVDADVWDEKSQGDEPTKYGVAHRHVQVRSKFKEYVGFSILSLFILFHLVSIGPSPKEELEALTRGYSNVLETSNLASNWSQKYTQEAHLAGKNYELAEFTADKFKEYGFDSKIEPFNVYINYPGEFSLKLVNKKGKVIYQPTLVEDALPEDPTTIGDDVVPAFHGYSANGNVTAEFVFANYGTKEDFNLLDSKKVEIKDKVVIVRYGKIFRGLKVKFAQELGAAGVLIYSDPSDDYANEDAQPYPKGPGRNPSSIQRGSVQFLSTLPGDPARFLTDEEKANGGLDKLDSIPRIPSLPISYKEVIPILKELNGKGLKLGFEGGLKDFDYSTGPSVGKSLNLYNNNEYKFQDIHNVYGLIEGREKDKVIILGNHRDAWIKGGAGDPNSGSATLLEIARGLNELFKIGYKPRYSILLASWDGEEYALLGSTAFAEKYSASLKKEIVAYINLDAAVTGSHLSISASPLLNKFLLDVADLIDHPEKPGSLRDQFLAENKTVSILGSGSDYTSFFEHLGITSVDLGFGTGKGDPVYHYHSNYDSYHWMSTYGDPGFVYHNTLAKLIGTLVLQISETKVLRSFNAEEYALQLKDYFGELVEQFPKHWFNETITLDDPSSEDGHDGETFRFINLVNITKSKLEFLIKEARHTDFEGKGLQKVWEKFIYKSRNPFKRFAFSRKVNKLNGKLQDFERGSFLHEEGLNGRPWFKHIVFASGRYTGYAGQKLPGLTEAVEDLDFKNAVKWTNILKKSVNYAAVKLSQ